ncbi:MFS general substrate transporter [Trematosphaeria pertusa]|uniref:MFS general substrate transporter n=1 Tax=Trematosphaeria pertusa TaxID=390896 RepID=A0A6A6IXW1_9PLEO|nr:MFS general substrate transporter [Trematosphaeria pertusa]KAF2255329.1 MFS general substrate transporter [Trematosphaeria pertusa]
MSLYEPSVRSSTWSLISRRVSQRFTTLEGWREIGLGVFTMGHNIRMFSIRHQFDPESFRKEEFTFTTPRDAPPVPSIASIEKYQDSAGGTIGKAPYHVFTYGEKWPLVLIVGAAAIFPGLTATIYLPALDRIARDFNVSLETINLTVTSFLLVQGIAPLFWGPLSDTLGRRSVLVYSFLIYVASSLTLSFSPNLPVLFVFRSLQGVAIASTISVGCAVIQDISPPPERDHYYSFYWGAKSSSLVLAPIIGGLFSNFLSFRSIFVFLFGMSVAVFIFILLFLPETLRSVAGNGTLPLAGMDRPLIWRLKVFGKPAHEKEELLPGVRPKLALRKFVEPFRPLKEKDIIVSLVFSGVIFAIWMVVTVSTVGLFKETFGLNEAFLGLVFLPNALGTIVGSTVIGNILAQDFQTACSAYKAAHSLPPSAVVSRHPLPADFPLEHTRLVRLPGLTVIFVIALSFYGFTLYYPSLYSLGGWIVLPLLLQFLISVMAHAICGIHQTLILDLWPTDSSAAGALSNLSRCVLAGVGVAVVQKMLDWIEVAPTFLALAMAVMVLVPLPVVQWYWGGDWRRARDARASADAVEQLEKV